MWHGTGVQVDPVPALSRASPAQRPASRCHGGAHFAPPARACVAASPAAGCARGGARAAAPLHSPCPMILGLGLRCRCCADTRAPPRRAGHGGDAQPRGRQRGRRSADTPFWELGSGTLALPPGPLQSRAEGAFQPEDFSRAWRARSSRGCFDQLKKLAAALDAGMATSNEQQRHLRSDLGICCLPCFDVIHNMN